MRVSDHDEPPRQTEEAGGNDPLPSAPGWQDLIDEDERRRIIEAIR